ncbi:hypothetical protein EJ070_19715 [Mesorhizobium sp. M1E.F.Ca.ET.045.02.1.1]|nr:hypothetical protein EJ070_19715 [Mesorhizobium sp. M1E.F.Ca.ET.045.02.1.1]
MNTLIRSSFSTNIKERKDASVAIFDRGRSGHLPGALHPHAVVRGDHLYHHACLCRRQNQYFIGNIGPSLRRRRRRPGLDRLHPHERLR